MARGVAGLKPTCKTPGCEDAAFRDGMCTKCYMRNYNAVLKEEKQVARLAAAAIAKSSAAAAPAVSTAPAASAAPPAPEAPKLRRQAFKAAGRGSHVKIMEKMEGVLTALFSSLENLGGPAYIEKALASDGKSYTLLKEILALGKKYMDFKAQEAESKRSQDSQNVPINYFVIKNLRIDPTDTGLTKDGDLAEEEVGLAAVFNKLKAQPGGKEYKS